MSNSPGVRAGIDYTDIGSEIGVVAVGDSDTKFEGTACELFNTTGEGSIEEELRLNLGRVVGQGVDQGGEEGWRGDAQEALSGRGEADCWESAERSPVGVKWLDANKGVKESPEHACLSAAK